MSPSPTVVFFYTTVQLKMIQVTKYESLESNTLIIWDIMMVEPQLGPTKKEVIDIRDRCWQRLLTSKYGVSFLHFYICVICTGWLCCGYFCYTHIGNLKEVFYCRKDCLCIKLRHLWSRIYLKLRIYEDRTNRQMIFSSFLIISLGGFLCPVAFSQVIECNCSFLCT